MAAGNWITQTRQTAVVIRVALAEQADYRIYYLLQDRGPDMTPPDSVISQREEQTDRQTDRRLEELDKDHTKPKLHEPVSADK